MKKVKELIFGITSIFGVIILEYHGWLGRNFNVIMNDNKNFGGLAVYPSKYEDFSFCINFYDLFDINFKGSPFTWWNYSAAEPCIFKRLDIIVINQEFMEIMRCAEKENLARTGSDYAQLLLSYGDQNQ